MQTHCPGLGSVYTIDALDRLIEVNHAFIQSLPPEFGIERPRQIVGRSLWEFVPSVATMQLWKVLLRRVRNIGAPVFIPMRIETYTRRHLIDFEVHALGNDDVRHVHQIIGFETRTAIALLDPGQPRDERTLSRCSWCSRVQVRLGLWLDIEVAHATLQLDEQQTMPRIADSACTTCKQSILQLIPLRAA